VVFFAAGVSTIEPGKLIVMHLVTVRQSVLAIVFVGAHSNLIQAEEKLPTLRDAYDGHFTIGTALSSRTISGRNSAASELAGQQFSSLTPENDMKWQRVHPERGRYNFERADSYINFAEKNDMEVIGHTLVWHSQTPRWVFEGENGKPVAREELLKRMREHIRKVAGRYREKVKGWDVVNEALSDGGDDILRDSPWRRIIGDDFLDYAFRYAREAAPKAELYYNDYNLEIPRKRENCLKLVKGMLERGVPIDGVGTQSHFQLGFPSLENIEATIEEFSALGLKVAITELDVDVLPRRNPGVADISEREEGTDAMNPYQDGLPDEAQQKLAKRYEDIFKIYLKHSDKVERVTFWGLSDGHTWLNGFPVRGRTNHPLLFDRELEPKPAFHALVELGVNSENREN
jgi:endo-1,4-beta-xylanase